MKVVLTQLHTVGGGGGIGSQRYSSTDSKSAMLYCSMARLGLRPRPCVRGLALAVPRQPTEATSLMLTDPAVHRRPVLRPRGRRRPRRGDSPLADAASVAVSTDGGASRLLRRRWLHGTSWARETLEEQGDATLPPARCRPFGRRLLSPFRTCSFATWFGRRAGATYPITRH